WGIVRRGRVHGGGKGQPRLAPTGAVSLTPPGGKKPGRWVLLAGLPLPLRERAGGGVLRRSVLAADSQLLLAAVIEDGGQYLELGSILAILDPHVCGLPAAEGARLVPAALLEIECVEHVDRVPRDLGVAHEHFLERPLGNVLEDGGRAEEARLSAPRCAHADGLAIAHRGERRRLIRLRICVVSECGAGKCEDECG